MKKITFKNALKTGAILVLTVLIAFNLLTAILSGLDLRDRLHWLPCSFLTVSSGSMEPMLSVGDVIFVWETPYGELRPGDIVTFHHGEEFITHRIERSDGTRFVTRGLANTIEDESTIGPEEYCAKLVFTIPGAAKVLDFFTQPGTAFLGISLIAGIFLFVVLVRRVRENKSEGEEKGRRQPAVVPALCLMMVASVFAVSPYMTSAKYVAKINEYTTVFAEPYYLTSNFLTQEGSDYSIRGWNGSNYVISLRICNYENSLLYNKLGRDDIYAIAVEKITSGGGITYSDGSKYSISLSSDNATLYNDVNGSFVRSDEFADAKYNNDNVFGPYIILGNDDKSTAHDFNIGVCAATEDSLQRGDKICFKLYAFTSPNQGYYQRLEGTFIFEVAQSQNFLSEPTLKQENGNLLVNYSITTNLLSGKATKQVEFNWDPDVLYINEYQPSVFNIMYNPLTRSNYFKGTRSKDAIDGVPVQGSLKMDLQAFSSVNLQFFKYDVATYISGSAITVHVVEEEEENTTTGGAITFPDDPDVNNTTGGAISTSGGAITNPNENENNTSGGAISTSGGAITN